jgi:hypothetical protein
LTINWDSLDVEEFKEPRHRHVVNIRAFVPELARDNGNEDERWMTQVHLEIKRYRCGHCKKMSEYILLNGHIVKGCGGMYSSHGHTCGRNDCTAVLEHGQDVREALCA